MKSIQTKFILLILGCVLLSSLVIGGAGVISAKKVIDKDSVQIMNLLCSDKSQKINAQLSQIEQSVNTLALYAVKQLDSVSKLKSDASYIEEYTNHIQDVAVNAANNTEGALAVYLRFNPEFTDPTSGLFWSKTVVNGNFNKLVPTDFSRYSPEDIEHVGWYYMPVKSGKPTWMEPYLNQNINVEMISFVIPIYVDNVTVGVVGMDIDFNIIKDIVEEIRAYDKGYAFLTDARSNIVYHKDITKGINLAQKDSSLRLIADDIKSGTSGRFLYPYTLNGEEKKLTFCSLDNGMRLVITASTGEIDGAKNKLITQNVIALVIIASLSVILTIQMTRHIIRPLKELNAAAQKIAGGDLSIALTYKTKDEVGTLANSFQQTVNHLQRYIDYINGLAYRDSLTGVKNKTAYQEAADMLEGKIRLGRPEFAVIVFDINGLKVVNDTLGHDFGDILIIDSCKIICKVFKHSPVFRIGGDEFVAILENEDYEHYQSLLEDFLNAMDEFNQYTRPDSKISIARGIALYEEDTDLTFGNVFKRADDAMYQNKATMKKLKEI